MGFNEGVIRRMDAGHIAFRCPACERMHIVRLRQAHRDGHTWEWNNSHSKPTLTPSVHVNPPGANHDPVSHTCHFYLREGVMEYLPDCTHAMAGQRVPLPKME